MKNVIYLIIGLSLLTQVYTCSVGNDFESDYVTPITNGDIEFAKKALAEDVRGTADWTLLEHAVLMDNLPMLVTLLKAGSDPKADMEPYENAIEASLAHESKDVVAYFRTLGLDVDFYIRKAEIARMAEKLERVGEGNARSLVIKSLQSPDSYSEKSVDLAWVGQDEQGRPAGIYKFEFAAQNGFGATLRGCRYVSFWLTSTNTVGYYNNTYMQACDSWGNGDQSAAVETLIRLNFQRETQRAK